MDYEYIDRTLGGTVDDNQMKEVRDLSEQEGRLNAQLKNTFKDRMYMGKDLPSRISIWGDPISRIPEGKSFVYGILGIAKGARYQPHTFGARMYSIYEDYRKTNPEEAKKIFPSQISPTTQVGWDDANMEPHELENYQIMVGKLRAKFAENYVGSEDWDVDPLEDKVTKLGTLYGLARRQASAALFDWIPYKDRTPANAQNFNIMLDNEVLPLPSMVRRLEQGNRKYKLEPVDMQRLNDIAIGHYADRVIPFLDANKENMTALKKINEKTGKSLFVEKVNDIWTRSLDQAKKEMLRTIGEEK
jgi:hypothetical protein